MQDGVEICSEFISISQIPLDHLEKQGYIIYYAYSHTKLQFIRRDEMYMNYGNSKLFLICSCKFCDRTIDENGGKHVTVYG